MALFLQPVSTTTNHKGLSMLDFILNINTAMSELVVQNAWLLYLVLSLIVFGETGLVVLPFLPGDSMLFAAGALSASSTGNEHGLNLWLLMILLTIAAVLGNLLNYTIGRWTGHWIIKKGWISQSSLDKTHAFYERWGGLALVAARFLPLFRTYVPFVAGTAEMSATRYVLWTILGASLWVGSLCVAGYLFGNIPFIKDNLNIIVLVGLAAAALPVLLGLGLKLIKFIRCKNDRKST
jgi:membrane-associated protein